MRSSMLLLCVLAACGTSGTSTESESDTAGSDTGVLEVPDLELTFSEAPVTLPDGVQFAGEVAYDDHESTVFDIMLPEADAPTPLVVYIHGGGFTGGSRSKVYDTKVEDLQAVLSAGVAYATIDYRLLDEVDTDGVLKPLNDSRRALQFLRYHHETLNVDPDRVVLYGGSAGAGTALWLGAHDDMADDTSPDPVEWESTRVRAVGLQITQSTYDLYRWEEVFDAYGITMDDMVDITGEQRMLSFYGVDAWEDLESAEVEAYRAEVDMLAWMDADDAPVWIESTGEETVPVDTSVLFHHPYHGQIIQERALEVGLEEVTYLPALEVEDESGEDLLWFFARHLDL